jgi:hypothetical protein
MQPSRLPGPSAIYHLPAPSAAPVPAAFVVCPLVLVSNTNILHQLWQEAVYRLAYEQAQAAARPSILERDLLAVWN